MPKPILAPPKNKARTTGAARPQTPAEVSRAVAACVGKTNPQLQKVATQLRRMVKQTLPESRETINPWGVPTFEVNGPVCLMLVGKNHVTFGFTRGTSLADHEQLLEGKGKNFRHVKLRDPEQVRDAHLTKLLLEAAALNRATPLGVTGRPKKTLK